MRVLDSVVPYIAHPKNFNPNVRLSSAIKFIVIHYTGNTNDSAYNNAVYFHDNPVESSAHYFVSENQIYQCVPDNHAAYSVGLGPRKQPYFQWPSMWKKITNSNSISVEICGSKNNNEGTDNVKNTAAMLVADLLEKYGLTPSCVYRHYDVTGKSCPAWAVKDPMKWLDFTLRVNNYFYGKEGDDMTDTPENYAVFKLWMERYEAEKSALPSTWETSAMAYCEEKGLITGGRPKANVTRGELATVLQRLE